MDVSSVNPHDDDDGGAPAACHRNFAIWARVTRPWELYGLTVVMLLALSQQAPSRAQVGMDVSSVNPHEVSLCGASRTFTTLEGEPSVAK